MPKAAIDADLDDINTHRDAWRKALEIARDQAKQAGDDVDYAYWGRELRVFDRTHALIAGRRLKVDTLPTPAASIASYKDNYSYKNAKR